MSNIYAGNATGDLVARAVMLNSVTLTGGSDAATLVLRNGSGGDALLTLKAAANSTVQWRSGSKSGVFFSSTVHGTFTGTGPLATVEVS